MGIEAYGFKIEPAGLEGARAREYDSSVRTQLTLIAQVAAGQVLFNSIRYWKIPILIAPYDFSEGACNATVENAFIDPATGIIHPRVLFTASVYGQGSPCWQHLVKYKQTNAGLPHEVLFHELIHAFRKVTKSFNRIFTIPPTKGALAAYTDEEEFIAVVTTNIFISDPSNRYKTGLRASHASKLELEKELSGSFEFFRSGIATFRLIEKFCKQNPVFTAALAKIPAKFNPLAAYYSDPKKARQLAELPSTYERDVKSMERKILNGVNPPRNPSVPVIPGLDTV